MGEDLLRSWLFKVQNEFVSRMSKLSDDLTGENDESEEDEEGDENEIVEGITGEPHLGRRDNHD